MGVDVHRASLPRAGECHLWYAWLPDDVASWLPLLSSDDAAEVARQRHERQRRTVVVSRALQRLVLGGYAGMDPTRVGIERSCAACGSRGHGRPSVDPGKVRLDYSVSHSGDLVALAVVGSGRVGLDVERLEPATDHDDRDGLAAYVLDQVELDTYRHLPEADRPAWLYRAWTRKEAAAKATGAGLTIEPSLVAAALTDRAPDRPSSGSPTLSVRDLAWWPGYAAAIAATVPLDVDLLRRMDRP